MFDIRQQRKEVCTAKMFVTPKYLACEGKNSIFNSTKSHWWMETVLAFCCVPLTAAFQCHARLKGSFWATFAAVRPFASTSPKESLRSVIHSVTWLSTSLCYIILLIMYTFFCSHVVQAWLMFSVGWSSDRNRSTVSMTNKNSNLYINWSTCGETLSW